MNRFELSAESLGFTEADLGIDTWRAALAELIGVLLFVFIGAGSVVVVTQVFPLPAGQSLDASRLVAIALAHGLAIATMVAATARISGGHINPAVTFSMIVTGRMKLAVGIIYIAAQLIGAVIGAALLALVLAGNVEGDLGAHSLGNALSSKGAGVIVEAILTFVLVFTVFATAVDRRGLGNAAPIAIGFAILIDHFIGVPLTGASMNPARSFGPALASGTWTDFWIYIVGPVVGAALGAVAYQLVRRPA